MHSTSRLDKQAATPHLAAAGRWVNGTQLCCPHALQPGPNLGAPALPTTQVHAQARPYAHKTPACGPWHCHHQLRQHQAGQPGLQGCRCTSAQDMPHCTGSNIWLAHAAGACWGDSTPNQASTCNSTSTCALNRYPQTLSNTTHAKESVGPALPSSSQCAEPRHAAPLLQCLYNTSSAMLAHAAPCLQRACSHPAASHTPNMLAQEHQLTPTSFQPSAVHKHEAQQPAGPRGLLHNHQHTAPAAHTSA
jgi:hypothetical protein